jgi:dynein heavy chain 2
LKTVLRGCGSLLATIRQSEGSQTIDDKREMEIAVQALRLNTLSKLTFADSIGFDALVRDMFPGISLKDAAYEQLKKRLKISAKHLGLIINERQVNSLACNDDKSTICENQVVYSNIHHCYYYV